MIPNDILLVLVAAVAFFLGYRMGRMSVFAEHAAPRSEAGPNVTTADAAGGDDPLPGPGSAPAHPRAAPPPASAGGAPAGAPTAPSSGTPRRTAAPPPARAGLLDPDGGKKR